MCGSYQLFCSSAIPISENAKEKIVVLQNPLYIDD